ncbi:hypothetical protein [Garicola koreensis]|uniref:Uncharacterized protein n=1 Tax=Garicola koreensis TaxID=1262554 RepID=A0A7W5TQD3_9MICC|nr:hypothetical protein [Garicola koreensis]MBB3667781.1 hypothetical protein [Garicola koreensis]
MSAPLSPTDFTADEAREFTDDLKLDYVILQGKIAQAFKGKIWIALGYEDVGQWLPGRAHQGGRISSGQGH